MKDIELLKYFIYESLILEKKDKEKKVPEKYLVGLNSEERKIYIKL